MTGNVGSVVVSEITSRVITKALQIFNLRPTVDEKLHKLEMLCIHIHGVVEASRERTISSKHLLRWQEKLQDAATDGDEVRFNRQIGTQHHDALAFATPGMFNCFHGAAKMLLSCGKDLQKLSSTVERLDKLSADTDQFLRLIDLEESTRKEEHQGTKRKRTFDSTNMRQIVRREAPERS